MMDVFHQESDAIRTLLVVIVATLRSKDRISSPELDEVFSVAGHLVRARWGPHSVADIVMRGCWEEVIEAFSELEEAPVALKAGPFAERHEWNALRRRR